MVATTAAERIPWRRPGPLLANPGRTGPPAVRNLEPTTDAGALGLSTLNDATFVRRAGTARWAWRETVARALSALAFTNCGWLGGIAPGGGRRRSCQYLLRAASTKPMGVRLGGPQTLLSVALPTAKPSRGDGGRAGSIPAGLRAGCRRTAHSWVDAGARSRLWTDRVAGCRWQAWSSQPARRTCAGSGAALSAVDCATSR